MSIKEAFDRFGHWTMEGSMPVSAAKFFSFMIALPTATIMAPILYFASENADNLEQTFENLDNSPSIVFQSVANCTSDGYSQADCEISQKNANDISKELGTTVSYDSKSECTTNHQSCEQRTWLMPMVTGSTTQYLPQVQYSPLTIAWQAAADDLSVSVPLDSGPDEGTAVRKDGKMFNLNFSASNNSL